jgi:hypothetical protein
MMNLTNRIAGLAGLLVLTGAAAFAQSEMKLEVPFTFSTPNATMAPGTYSIMLVKYAAAAPVYRVRNMDTKKTILAIAPTRVTRKGKDLTDARVEFQCAGEYCALATIYNATAATGDSLPVRLRKTAHGEKVASVMIPAKL